MEFEHRSVRRSLARLPADFMFQLTVEKFDSLRSQIATLKTGRGQHRKYLPLAFTERGAIHAPASGASRAAQTAYRVRHASGQGEADIGGNSQNVTPCPSLLNNLSDNITCIACITNQFQTFMNSQPFLDLPDHTGIEKLSTVEKRRVIQLINAFIERGQLKRKMESRA